MTDSVPKKIDALAAQLEGLEAAAEGLDSDPRAAASLRRIARVLETAATTLGLTEVAAGAKAIERAADAHLTRSVENFLARIEELRREGPADDVTILVVEDNRTVAAAIQAYIKGPGRTLIVAESAAEGISIMQTRDIDVVILDLILPDRDGRDVLVTMREQAATATTPVIVVSSTSSAVARAECLAVGADDFLEKPADPTALRSAVVRQIKNGRIRRHAVRDGLTGLPNRAGISAEFDEQKRIATKSGTPLTVAALTIDSLAEVTMKMGRDAGDQYLLEVTSVLHEALGKGDRLGRWEIAELVAVIPESTVEDARATLERAFQALQSSDTLTDVRKAGIEVTLSGGVTAAEPGQSLTDVISAAERSLFQARANNDAAVYADGDALTLPIQKILLVEDDRVTATLIHHRLVRDGHEVVSFADGLEAFSWAENEPFDLAILDVKVPGMDGFELLARVREIPALADIPIIMLTGMGSEADVIRGLDLGADDYILKPFSPSELLARVRRLLLARATGGGAPERSEPREAEA